MSWFDGLTEPARRHACEICKQVFECHLCEITNDHPLHRRTTQQPQFPPDVPILICEDCILEHSLLVVPVVWGQSNSQYIRSRAWSWKSLRLRFYDHLTGDIIQ